MTQEELIKLAQMIVIRANNCDIVELTGVEYSNAERVKVEIISALAKATQSEEE